MLSADDLAVLMYRAPERDVTVSGQVQRQREIHLTRGGPLHAEESGSLEAAPGGRYRAELTSGSGRISWLISDGESAWEYGDESRVRRSAASGVNWLRRLLSPAWLLAGYRLEVTGEAEHAGRAAYIVAASMRDTRGTFRDRGQVTALVDAELGIVLRYEEGPRRHDLAEITALRVAAADAVDPGAFAPPVGLEFTDQEPVRSPGGVPANRTAVDDRTVRLLYRGLSQQLTARLTEHCDAAAVRDRLRSAAAEDTQARRHRRLAQAAADTVSDLMIHGGDFTAAVAAAPPGRYRMEVATPPARRPELVVSDGQHQWTAFGKRVLRQPPAPVRPELAALLDPSWLLDGYRLSSTGPAPAGGRAAITVVAEPLCSAAHGTGPISGTPTEADWIEAVIDAELGVTLRLAWRSATGQVLLSAELTTVSAAADPEAFGYEPPPGARVVHSTDLLASMSAAGKAGLAARAAASIGKSLLRRQD